MLLQGSVECIELRVLPCPGGSSASHKRFVCRTKRYALYGNRQGHAHANEHDAFSGTKEMHMALVEFSVALISARVGRANGCV